ncbi:hypothetical protein CGRA01v4_06867 [Colletotrichum graminicola]|nr:hypothetical protein CGRA01v4_06867 [Colletotrichum graminicola]
MPSEPAPAVLPEQKLSAEQPVSSQATTISNCRDDGALCPISSCSPFPSARGQLHSGMSMIIRARANRQRCAAPVPAHDDGPNNPPSRR